MTAATPTRRWLGARIISGNHRYAPQLIAPVNHYGGDRFLAEVTGLNERRREVY